MSKINNNSNRLNEKLIGVLEELANIMLKKGEPFRSRAYQKAQETIMSYQYDILNPIDLKGLPGIGSTIMEKLEEYVKTGTLSIIEREKNNPANILSEIYGIGPKKAVELVENGITSISQLRQNQHMLNDIQKVGLHYYEDVLKRIPRSEIDQYKSIFANTFQKVSTKNTCHFEIVGSYRRGSENSGDIDVIITSETPNVFIHFIEELIKNNIILEILSRGATKCLVMAKISSSDSVRRVDFLYTSLEEFPFAILYFTGSKIFNTVMRNIALQKGVTMNEHGLYNLIEDGKKKGGKVNHIFTSEKDIFDYLDMEYKKPEERIDGRAVVIKSKQQTMTNHKMSFESDDSEKDSILLEKKAKNQIQKKSNIIKSNKNTDILDIITKFKKNGITIIDKLNEKQIAEILNEANKAYYNQGPLLTDNEYDIMQEYFDKKYPSNKLIHQVGAPVERNKVLLPYSMGSMDKIKPDTNALISWSVKYKGPYVLSCKLDGVSGLYTTENSTPKLYTRGDGKIGQDISHIIPYLDLPKEKDIVIRGEFIISKPLFETKYKTIFANPRNMVAGIINQKSINETIIKDLDFVAYEVIKPVLKPSEQLKLLTKMKVNTVMYKTETKLTNELLSHILMDWRKNYIYEIDGVIVTNDATYERKIGNPDFAFAFKMVLTEQIAEAKVVDVIWTPSKDGYLKPRVQIEPIQLGGVCIEYATGFNGSFIYDNKVGIGAVIELIRSGDVIPHIRKVRVPASEPKMPSVPYKWNDTHIDILLEDATMDETVKEKVITGFFKGIGVEGLGSGNITRMIQSGFDTIPKIVRMEIIDFLQVQGFQEKTANKLFNGIKERLQEATLITIMSATNIFGRGFSDKKIEIIMESYPEVLLSKDTNVQKILRISSIKGMAEKTAQSFVEKIPQFISFMKESGLISKINESNDNEINNSKTSKTISINPNNPLFGKTIVITGFRDASIQDKITNMGAKIGTSVSKNTSIVIVKNKDDDTGKLVEARRIGILIMELHEFKEKFL